jgi:KDPG and KHG aldolase
VQTTANVEALRVVADAVCQRGLIVGAGTVVTVEQVRLEKDAGAAFTVSPGFDVGVVRGSHEAGLTALPGVATATEAWRALGEGLTGLMANPAAVRGSSRPAAWTHRTHAPSSTRARASSLSVRRSRTRRSCPRWRRCSTEQLRHGEAAAPSCCPGQRTVAAVAANSCSRPAPSTSGRIVAVAVAIAPTTQMTAT